MTDEILSAEAQRFLILIGSIVILASLAGCDDTPANEPEGFEITPLYRLIWHQSFYLALVVIVYVMVERFRLYIDRTGRLWGALNKNSYGVFIFHVIVIGVFGTLPLHTGLPAVAKYLLLIVLAYVTSNLLVSAYRALSTSIRRDRGQALAASME